MTRPMPEEERVPATMPTSGENRGRERAKLARKWAYLVSMTAYLPLPHAEIERQLLEHVDRLAERVTRLVGAMASGYAEAIRTSALRQQDELNRALVEAVTKGDRSRKVGDARFDEVLSGSDSGIAITDLDGRFERTNDAFDAMVNRSADATLFDLVHGPDR